MAVYFSEGVNSDAGFDPTFILFHATLRTENCTLPSIIDFPNIMRKKSVGYTIACILITAYIFIMLAIICGSYLVPSIERLCYALRISYDVTGATFLALATSAPELFVCFVDLFISNGDMGIGTIVGSYVFNILALPAICGVFAHVKAKLDWWPIVRDCSWCFISICVLFGSLFDNVLQLHEAIILVSLYFVYLFVMIFDRKIKGLCLKVDKEKDILTENPMTREEESLKSFKDTVCGFPKKEDKICCKIWFAIKYPAILLLALTTPSARTIFFLCFLMAIMWICLLSYLVTWTLTIIGYNIGVPDSIMGITCLSFGTSVPEAVSSYIVTRKGYGSMAISKGYGSMAISNGIGSNTFDIFICLGLPWLFYTAIKKKNFEVNSNGLYISTGMLIVAIAILFFSLLGTKFVLGKIVGWICLVSYFAIITTAVILEMLSLKTVCNIESGLYSSYTK